MSSTRGTGVMLARNPDPASGKWLLFDCNWKHDLPAGHGRFVEYPCGDVYEVTFDDDHYFSHCVCKYAEGDMYVGELDECGHRHGRGKYTDACGEVVWDGQWEVQWPDVDDARLALLLPRIVDNHLVDGRDRTYDIEGLGVTW